MSSYKRNVIAVDGYSGVGSGTIAETIAGVWTELGADVGSIDTGSLYRSIGITACDVGLDPETIGIRNAQDIIAGISYDDERGIFMPAEADGDPDKAEALIRNPHADKQSSTFGSRLSVRTAVNERCNAVAIKNQDKIYVFDGRQEFTRFVSIGHYPLAGLLVFCPAEERAKRRVQQGQSVLTIEELDKQIRARDEQDSTREHEPIRAYEGEQAKLSALSHRNVAGWAIEAQEARALQINNPEGTPIQFMYDTAPPVSLEHYRVLAKFLFDATKDIRDNT